MFICKNESLGVKFCLFNENVMTMVIQNYDDSFMSMKSRVEMVDTGESNDND